MYDVAHNFINIKKIARQNLTKSQYNTYETADYCHICKKVYDESKKTLVRYTIFIIVQVNIGVPHIQYVV